MLVAAWTSRSDSASQIGHLNIRSDSLRLISVPHSKQCLLVGNHWSRTTTLSYLKSRAFIRPKTECCIVRDRCSFWCHWFSWSSCMITTSFWVSAWTILLDTSFLRLLTLLYSFLILDLVLYQLLEPLIWFASFAWRPLSRSLSSIDTLYLSPSEVVIVDSQPRSIPIMWLFVFCFSLSI